MKPGRRPARPDPARARRPPGARTQARPSRPGPVPGPGDWPGPDEARLAWPGLMPGCRPVANAPVRPYMGGMAGGGTRPRLGAMRASAVRRGGGNWPMNVNLRARRPEPGRRYFRRE